MLISTFFSMMTVIALAFLYVCDKGVAWFFMTLMLLIYSSQTLAYLFEWLLYIIFAMIYFYIFQWKYPKIYNRIAQTTKTQYFSLRRQVLKKLITPIEQEYPTIAIITKQITNWIVRNFGQYFSIIYEYINAKHSMLRATTMTLYQYIYPASSIVLEKQNVHDELLKVD